jgi:hypothetical protein
LEVSRNSKGTLHFDRHTGIIARCILEKEAGKLDRVRFRIGYVAMSVCSMDLRRVSKLFETGGWAMQAKILARQ